MPPGMTEWDKPKGLLIGMINWDDQFQYHTFLSATAVPGERRKLLLDALRLTLWRATGSTPLGRSVISRMPR